MCSSRTYVRTPHTSYQSALSSSWSYKYCLYASYRTRRCPTLTLQAARCVNCGIVSAARVVYMFHMRFWWRILDPAKVNGRISYVTKRYVYEDPNEIHPVVQILFRQANLFISCNEQQPQKSLMSFVHRLVYKQQYLKYIYIYCQYTQAVSSMNSTRQFSTFP